MKTLRTPDEAFAGVPDFDHVPNYVTIDDTDGGELRVAFIDVGPRDGDVVLCLHGEPSWSFLYRRMIPVFLGAGLRVVCPDLVGFGRSDKPTERADYSYARHVEWMRSTLFDHLDLTEIALVCQDWGGLIGLRLVAEHPERFARVVAANTLLPTGDHDLGEAFFFWREFSQSVESFPTGFIISSATQKELTPDVIAAYDAPFPDERYLAGARQFPLLVPATPDDPAAAANRAAWESLRTFDRPFLCAFSDGDPITTGHEVRFQTDIPGALGQPHTTIEGGGHFLQEDRGPELAAAIVEFIRAG